MSDKSSSGKAPGRFAKQWHHRPTVPIHTSPLFQLPPNPKRIARWFVSRWFVFGENLILVVLATLCWFYFQPSLETTKYLAFDWIGVMFLRNAILISMVAGGAHYWLHTRKSQGNKLKYDPRELDGRSSKYSFNHQVRDNMFWTLTSGVFFWTAYEALMLWAMANGYVPMLAWFQNPIWFVLLFVLTPVWISFHFYLIHRALHWPPLYKLAHALHHRNTNVGPWSGLSMHPIEHAMFFSSVLVHWFVTSHPVHILFHMQHQALTASTSHAGFEGILVKDKNALAMGTFHHQLHHRYFECNYGNLDVPWDKLFGSYHDGTEASHNAFLERRRKRMV